MPLERCIDRASRDGVHLPVVSVPSGVLEAVTQRMSEADPQADVRLANDASHGDQHSTYPIIHDSASEGDDEAAGDGDALYGEADEERKPD